MLLDPNPLPPTPATDTPDPAQQTPRRRSSSLDLRRHVGRDVIDLLIRRSEHLPLSDRSLVLAIYDKGLRVADVARGLNRSPRVLRRRIRAVASRVLSPRFAFVAARVTDWHDHRRHVAIACILHGLSMREAAEELNLSLHTVRRHHDAILALSEHAS